MKKINYYIVLIVVLGLYTQVNSQTTKEHDKKQINTTAASDKSSTTSFLLEKLLKNGMPVSLNYAKSVLGSNFKLEEDELFGSTYIWRFRDGGIFELQDINYNVEGIELDILFISSQQNNNLICTLGLTINQSTYNDCKALFPNLKNTVDGISRRYKFIKGKTWFFLSFNERNILTRISCASWEIDTTG